MADTRHRNAAWRLTDPVQTWEEVNAAILMDIRDELQLLNRRLGCSNFLELPYNLRMLRRATERIDKRMSEKVKLK